MVGILRVVFNARAVGLFPAEDGPVLGHILSFARNRQ